MSIAVANSDSSDVFLGLPFTLQVIFAIIALIAIVGVAWFIGIMVWDEFGFSIGKRSQLEKWRAEEERERFAPIVDGTILCDYSDDTTLKSLERQLELKTPDLIEDSTSDSSSFSGGIVHGPAKVGAEKGQGRDHKETYNVEWDRNVALKRIVLTLAMQDELIRTLDVVPTGSIDQGLRNRIAQYREGKEPSEQRVIDGLRAVLINDATDRLKANFDRAIESGKQVLVEANWTVELTTTNVKLVLMELRTPPDLEHYEYADVGELDYGIIDIPEGVRVATEFDRMALTTASVQRFQHGQRIRASVLGRVVAVQGDNELHIGISPTAVYSRSRPKGR